MSGLDDPDRLAKALVAKNCAEWVEIYIEIVTESLLAMGQILEGEDGRNKWRDHQKILRKFAKGLDIAGLDMEDLVDIKIEKAHQNPFSHVTVPERIRFTWKDGGHYVAEGERASVGWGFILWWQNAQLAVLGADDRTLALGGGQRRILQPGDAEHQAYFDAKRQHIEEGMEPDDHVEG